MAGKRLGSTASARSRFDSRKLTWIGTPTSYADDAYLRSRHWKGEWLDEVVAPDNLSVATFDTRIAKARHMPGSAAKAAAKGMRKHGYSTLVKPESFYVDDVAGPLRPGEVERARAWGEKLAAEVSHPADAR